MVIFVCFTLMLFFQAQPASAADIAVNSSCSLANAITASNTDTATGGCSAGSGVDTISLSGDITLSAALPQMTTGVTINGNSHTIDGASSYRIFDISTPYNADGNSAAQRVFTINNLTMRNGNSSEGGAIRVNGARADNLASLTLSNCNVYSSRSSAHAGGIFARNALLNVGTTTLMSGNSATHSGGAIWADTSTVNITGSSSLINNSAGLDGGSLFVIDSTVTISNAAITDSSATERGGGIAYYYRHSMAISNTVLSNNSAGIDGGGFYAHILSGNVSLSNSTLYGNTHGTGANAYHSEGGSVTVDSATTLQ